MKTVFVLTHIESTCNIFYFCLCLILRFLLSQRHFYLVESLNENLPYGPPSDSSTSTLANPASLDLSGPTSQQVNIHFNNNKSKQVETTLNYQTIVKCTKIQGRVE